MLCLEPEADDDLAFLQLVNRLVDGVLAVHTQEDARIFKIDNWFDHKWLRFSGKAVGAVGVWQAPPTLPPFVPNRLVRRWHFRRDDEDGFRLLGPGPDVHHRGTSAANLTRRVQRIAPSSSLFWFSGSALASGRGSLMGYVPVDRGYWTWFLAFSRDGDWKVSKRKNIHDYEVRDFLSRADRAQAPELV